MMVSVFKAFDTAGILTERPRARVHTANNTFEGKLWRKKVKGELFLTITDDDGKEVAIPASNVEYIEDGDTTD